MELTIFDFKNDPIILFSTSYLSLKINQKTYEQ